MSKQVSATKQQVINELWSRGELSWILYPHQRPIYKKIREVLLTDDPDMNSYVLNISRQFGKSFIMFLIAVEDCIRNKGWTNVFIGPLKSQVNEIINGKTYGTIFASCPTDLIPKYVDSALCFTNGSRIRLAGTDNRNYENLRGGAANTIFLDEAGFMSNLDDGVLPTVEPMTKTTGGKLIFSSTPPDSLDHDYHEVLRYHDECNLIATYTIWDDKSLSEKQLQKIINQCKGQDTTKFKREFECKRIADSSRQVIPQLAAEDQISLLVTNEYLRDPLRQYWKRYVIADWGGKDKTAIVFAHYNYRTKKVIVEDHLDLNGESITGSIIALRVKEMTKKLWNDTGDISYYCDNNNVLIQNDMNIKYKLPFVATDKGRLKSQMVEKVKDWIYDERVWFAPTAEFVLQCITSAHWSKNGDEFARSKIYGHYDALAAIVYLIRNIDELTDPVPALLGVNSYTQFVDPRQAPITANQAVALNSIFNPRKGLSFN